jgi:transposase
VYFGRYEKLVLLPQKKLLQEAKSKGKSPVLKKGCECILLASHLSLSVSQLAQHSKIKQWEEENDLYLFFIASYCPASNVIEIFWIKYEWLFFQAYHSFENLKNELINIIENKYQKYNINLV